MTIGTTEAVLFDLDGTLLDTIDDLAACMNAALAECGLATTPVAEHKLMVGDGVRNYVLRAMGPERRGDEDLVGRITEIYQGLYAERWAVKTRPYEGVKEMLAELAARRLRLAVLSNKPDHFTRKTVAHFLPDVPFDGVRGARDGVGLKPDPTSAVAIAETLGVGVERFGYVGDTATDMRTARAAGMRAVGVLWGFRSRDELINAGAESLIAHPAELAGVLNV